MTEMDKMICRGRRLDNQEWVEGYFVILKWYLDEKPIAVIIPEDATLYPHGELCGFYHVDPETVGRFTSLTDKNGKKIFEKDVVRITSSDYMGFDEIGKVEFKFGCYGVSYFVAHVLLQDEQIFHRIGEVTEIREHGCCCTMKYSYEVIGNIHDNPELTKGE